MVACGDDFTVAVTEDGELFAWGDGRDGHLGLGTVLHQQMMILLLFLQKQNLAFAVYQFGSVLSLPD